jgi:hypothetical protein
VHETQRPVNTRRERTFAKTKKCRAMKENGRRHQMRESCSCGRSGELVDPEPILDAKVVWSALRCPDCGHVDYLN